MDAARLPESVAARLEAALAEADAARGTYAHVVRDGQRRALVEALDDPERCLDPLLPIAGDTLTAADWDATLRLQFHWLDADTAARLSGLSPARRKAAHLHVGGHGLAMADPGALQRSAERLCRAYASVESIHPLSAVGAGDAAGIAALTAAVQAVPPSDWSATTPAARVDWLRGRLAAAFPTDDVAALRIEIVRERGFLGAFDPATDRIMIGLAALMSPGEALWAMAHEFQHRRQHRLVDALEAGTLAPGSGDEFRARLFRINFDGYLGGAPIRDGRRAALAAIRAYAAQPIEANAFAVGRHFDPAAARRYEAERGLSDTGLIADAADLLKRFADLVRPKPASGAARPPAPKP